MSNVDKNTVLGFGDEWERFDQSELDHSELEGIFASYFGVFPWESLSSEAVGIDIGCGSGRWAKLVAPKVGHLHCLDPSSAIVVAQRNLADHDNVTLHQASLDEIPLENNSLDFAYSLGVLHHVPDTRAAIMMCSKKLKPGAPLLLYLYYRFDNRPKWYHTVWKCSELIRAAVSKMPFGVRFLLSQILAITVYWPLARLARFGDRIGMKTRNWPLSFYKDRSLYVMRTDALDRFGTRLEQRFTRDEIAEMLSASGLTNIRFSESEPYWCVVATKV